MKRELCGGFLRLCVASGLMLVGAAPSFAAEQGSGHAAATVSGESGAAAEAPTVDPQTPEEVVRAYASLLFDQHKVREAFERYVAPDLIQHDFLMPNGRDATLALLEQRQANTFISKNQKFVAQGDIVVVFHRGEVLGQSLCIMEMYRVEDGLIAEHWQVKQEIPEVRANDNEMC